MSKEPKNIFILTGAGISAESGLKTFRGADGLWEGHRVEDVCTPEAFSANPKLVQHFYNQRRRQLAEVEPNGGHLALADLEKNWEGDFILVTQNVDDLHERAGSKNVLHMHGELRKTRCLNCKSVHSWLLDIDGVSTNCPGCQQARLRPHIVWFGEIPFGMNEIEKSVLAADIFIAVGTSGVVYPAAALVQMTPSHCRKIEVNLEPSAVSPYFDEHLHGEAGKTLPELVRELLRV